MQQCLYIIDRDVAVRDMIGVIFSLHGYSVRGFEGSSEGLMAARLQCPSCLIVEADMPGRSGLDILRELNADHYPAPIFITSHKCDIPTVVKAIKHGAFDFIEKPFNADDIVTRVDEAVGAYRRQNENYSDHAPMNFYGSYVLTPRERDVLKQITDGASNKEAGRELGISPRTIEVHRARIMEKLGAKNAADLVRIVMRAEHQQQQTMISSNVRNYSAAMGSSAAS